MAGCVTDPSWSGREEVWFPLGADSRKTVLRQRIDDVIHRHLRTTVRPSSLPVGTQLPSASREDWGLWKTRRLCQGAWGPPAHRPLRLCTLHLVQVRDMKGSSMVCLQSHGEDQQQLRDLAPKDQQPDVGKHKFLPAGAKHGGGGCLCRGTGGTIVREMRLTRGQKCTYSQLQERLLMACAQYKGGTLTADQLLRRVSLFAR